MTIKPTNNGWIEVICGNMFSGKTEELLRRLRRAKIAKLSTIVFKPEIDKRYSENKIVSHIDNTMKSLSVKNSSEILKKSKDYNVVGIDEAQFFDNKLINICKELAKINTRVIVAGLDTDYKGKPFGPMQGIMCESDYLDKLRAICVKCGNPASYTQRITKQTEQVVIGETNIYEARCRHCYMVPKE